jgi:uncharacterized repeat protein (TIGR01451 family)/LPXTG-motif cell wall-anchored protein
MNKIIAAIRRAPKRTAALTMLAVAVVIPAALFAWGPENRATYTTESPAPHVTFNSITNNPAHGDERNFVQIKQADAANSTYTEEVALEAGKQYEVFVYYHNNAASNLNDAAHNFKGIAQNAAMRVQMPASVKAGEKARVTGFVSASNATPQQVWDEAYASSANGVALRYVQGSAKIHNFGATNGASLPNELLTTGTPLGFDALDGKVPGCDEFAGYVTFRFQVDQPNFEVSKQVSPLGKNTYSESVTAKPGEQVEYKIQYKNTGTVQQDDVVIKDVLPRGMSYVANSTKLASSASNGQYADVTDNGITGRGINIGSYAPNGNAFVKFTAKVADNDQLAACGVNTLVNTATAETENGSKSDTANVVVTKECAPGKINVCELATKKVITINENQFDASKHSKNLKDCEVVTVTELPKTGPAETILTVLGAGSLIAATGYYIASRRALIGR